MAQPAFRFRVAAAFFAEAERSAFGRAAAAAPPSFPPRLAEAFVSGLPRPEPDLLPPPLSLLTVAQARRSPHTAKFLVPLGLAGGFVDATGGGGWGPVSTTSLLSAGKTAPRTVIGSVDTSEFLVSFAASLGFVLNLGLLGIEWGIVLALLAGGLVAAPIAAWLVSRIPAQVMGVAVGGIIIMTNLKTLFDASQLTSEQVTVGFTLFAAVWVAMTAWTAWRHEKRRRAELAAREAAETEWSI